MLKHEVLKYSSNILFISVLLEYLFLIPITYFNLFTYIMAFGATQTNNSRIGLGLAALGRPGYINLGHQIDLLGDYDVENMEQRTHQMLDLAFEKGINYFDTAQSYGKAESFLGNWLQQNPNKSVAVGSKWGYYYTANWKIDAEAHEIKDHSLDRFLNQWPESKQRLSPALKLYQVHSATFESGILKNNAVLNELAKIKAEGYTVGLSLSGTQQSEVLDEALSIKIDGQALFGSVQATYNIFEQSAKESLEKAYDNGLEIIIKEGLANGRLTARYDHLPSIITEIAHNHQVGEDAIALAYILQKEFPAIVLSGASTPEHLLSNLKASTIYLEQKEMKALDQLKRTPAEYWSERKSMDWN